MNQNMFDGILASANFPAEIAHSARRDGARTLHTFSLSWQPDDAVSHGAPALHLALSRDIIDIHSGTAAAAAIARSRPTGRDPRRARYPRAVPSPASITMPGATA